MKEFMIVSGTGLHEWEFEAVLISRSGWPHLELPRLYAGLRHLRWHTL